MTRFSNVVLLAGGGGGARMADGLAQALPAGALTVIGNVADDELFYGLHVSPDIDTLLYTLSGCVNRKQGWGIAGDQKRALQKLSELGAPAWMTLGDADLGMHIWRSWQLQQGKNLTDITLMACQALGARACILPATNDPIATHIITENGTSHFQEWFVRDRCKPKVRTIYYEGNNEAKPSQEVLSAIHRADLIVLAPSNPWLSIEPILSIHPLKTDLIKRRVPCVAVSPLVGNRAIKGPLTKLMVDLGLSVSLSTIVNQYRDLIDAIIIDTCDQPQQAVLSSTIPHVWVTDTIMSTPSKSKRLAQQLLKLSSTLQSTHSNEAGNPMDSLVIAIPMKDPQWSKTRLAGDLSDSQREQLAFALFQNTVTFFKQTYPDASLATVTASKTIADFSINQGAQVIHEPIVNGLNNAAQLASNWANRNAFDSLLIIPADIPLLIKSEIDELLNARNHYDVIIAPSENGGTNALLLSPPTCLTFHYGKNSAKIHEKHAQSNKLRTHQLYLSHLAQDIDTLPDLLSLTDGLILQGLDIQRVKSKGSI